MWRWLVRACSSACKRCFVFTGHGDAAIIWAFAPKDCARSVLIEAVQFFSPFLPIVCRLVLCEIQL